MEYYPILITVYTRIEHLEKLINSLKENDEASETDIYIGSDFPKRSEDIKDVNMVRKYLQTISGFKKIHLFFWEKNIGQKESIVRLKNEIRKEHDGFIFFEDDNIVSKYYLSFMNYNLNKWRDDNRIACVCGYFYPINISELTEYDSIFLKEYNGWGSGFWFSKDFYMDKKDKQYFIKQRHQLKKFKKISMTSYYIIKSDLRYGKVYGDGRMAFQIFIENQFAVFPRISLVRNIGQDGSGIHSGINKKLQKQSLKDFKPQKYPEDVIIDNRIQRIVSSHRSYNLIKELKINFSYFIKKYVL